MTEQEQILQRQVIAVFAKVGIAIRNGTKVSLTQIGSVFVDVSYQGETYRIH
jgi:proline racemase